jgi:sialate O-acetylesterase
MAVSKSAFRQCLVALAVFICCQGTAAAAGFQLNSIFSNGMVLQQGVPVPIWGTAEDGERIAVEFQGKQASSVAKAGRWLVRLENLKTGGPFEMIVRGKQTLRLHDVYVGEVWLCAGECNMEFPLKLSASRPAQVNHLASIRLFHVAHALARSPAKEVSGSWLECTSSNAANFSAVAIFFGMALHKSLDVPIGLIEATWSDSPIDAWVSQSALEGHRDRTSGDQTDIGPSRSKEARQPQAASVFNGMIAPLTSMAIRGVVWYQGESDVSRASQYQALLSLLIEDWRQRGGQGDFPFLFVQLAPYKESSREPQESDWAELREAQLSTSQTIAKTAMVVITDSGDPNEIQPRRKEPVGQRLALAALVLAYGHTLEHSGPTLDRMQIEDDKVILSFKHMAGGLIARQGPLNGFALAGEDHRFHNAEAVIRGDKVVVSSLLVAKPVAVRFGWADFPDVNLCNKAGLPASPFRTDRWPRTVKASKPALFSTPSRFHQ